MVQWRNGLQPKQFVKPCLLLLLQERSDYGYDLVARLRALGVEDDSAAVYRVLRSLEAEGAVTSRWREPVAGPARRVYEITAAGGEVLDDWATGLHEGRQVVDGFLARYQRSRPHRGLPRRAMDEPAARRARP